MCQNMPLSGSFEELTLRLRSLVIFRGLLRHEWISRLSDLLACPEKDMMECAGRYAEFAAAVLSRTESLSRALLNLALEDENFYMLRRARGQKVSQDLERCLETELETLQALSRLSSQEVKRAKALPSFLPDWETEDLDFSSVYRDRMDHIGSHGYGIFAQYHTFVVKDGAIVPVASPDPARLSQLRGYQEERRAVVDNTLALLKGKPAANVLLYGDAGTGKSSTVKAIANEYKEKGLRLIEVTKQQLHEIPALMDSLSQNPLKFILFIDDLSFTSDDDDFSALKAILEGSISAKSNNLAVYATSNRRHLVKESFSDRNGDDIHFNDTMEEMVSLSARFGLSITFSKPGKDLYLEIVEDLAEQYQLQVPKEELFRQAEIFALRRSGRSPRAARQFVEAKKSEED